MSYRRERDDDRGYDERDDGGRGSMNQGGDYSRGMRQDTPDYRERSGQDRGSDYSRGMRRDEYDYGGRGSMDQGGDYGRGMRKGDYARNMGRGGNDREGMYQSLSSYNSGGMNDIPRGQHTGRGPKGYKRSDERIKEEICETLSRHGDIDASEIEVEVRAGEVTLSGTVDDRRTKRHAVEVIEDISGVQDVHNQIRVRKEQGNQQHQQGMQGQAGMNIKSRTS